MARPIFEIDTYDAAGRIGRLTVPRAECTVDTPALLPVVNPHLQLVPPGDLATDFGAEILITNAYVFHRSDDYRNQALTDGLHDVLGFPGPIMTDSGSFQLAEYGEIDVDTPEILEFQARIGSDIATPVDVPTPPTADRATAAADLGETGTALRTAAAFDGGEMLVSGPIQGGSYPDLRESAAREAYEQDLDVYPIGGVVPLLTEYQFADVVEVVMAAQRGLGADAPVHLFGAGHPMMFALAVAMGCDLFDSAAYALYARRDRYLTTAGTTGIDELSVLPCECPVCTATTPGALRGMDTDERTRQLARHNLYVSFGELRRIRQAIRDGELLELVERRARGHPDVLDGYRAYLEQAERVAGTEPATNPRPFFYLSSDSAARPEVRRAHDRLDRLPQPDSVLLIDLTTVGEPVADAHWEPQDGRPDRVLPAAIEPDGFDAWWYVIPPFGPVPPTLSRTYPFTAEWPDRMDHDGFAAAAAGISEWVAIAAPQRVTLVHNQWPETVRGALPAVVEPVAASHAEKAR